MRFETQTNLYDNQPLITKLTSHDTRFDVVQGEINALISESEMTELVNGGSTMYSAMNDIKVDVSGLHADLSEMNTTIDGQSGQITQLNSRQAEYEASLESLSATLSDTNATLYGDGETAGITTRMTNIEATASGINFSVSSLSSNLQNNYYNKSAVDNIASGISSSASSALTSAVNGLQNQIDGKIETWCGDVAPTASNYPASDWTTSAIKDQHIGDLYYDTKGGYSYQYSKTGNTYSWNVKTTSGINDAILLAGNKKRVFVAQPVPPYEIGDLWVQGANGDILRCGTARSSGNYNSSDWVKASKYTDDSTLNTWLTNTYASDKSNLTNGISDLQTQVDGKIETWTGDNPATAWTTSAERTKHIGDLWYDTNSSDVGYQKYFRYTGSEWAEITANPPSAVVTTINSKGKIFTGQPTTPYNVGDLWVQGAGGEILRCKTAKASGAYDSSHWEKASKYTDDTTANNVATNLANNYSTTTQMNSAISQTAQAINLEVSQKVGVDEIISRINQSAESISIDAGKINLNGYTTINGNFSIDETGKLTILSGREGSNAQVSISGDNLRTQRSDGSTGIMFSGPFLSIYGYDYDGRVGLIAPFKIANGDTVKKSFGIFSVHDMMLPSIDSDEDDAVEVFENNGLTLGTAKVYRTSAYEEKSYSVTSFVRMNYQDNDCIGIYKPINTTTQFIDGANLNRIAMYPSGAGGSSIVFQSRALITDTYSTKSYITSTNTPLGQFILKDGSLTLQSRTSDTGTFQTFITLNAENYSSVHYSSSRVTRNLNYGDYIEFQVYEGNAWHRRARMSATSYQLDFIGNDNKTYRASFLTSTTYPLALYEVASNGTLTKVKQVVWQSV